MAKQNFTGFYKETIKFLNDLSKNNNKIWFEKNKSVYQEFLLAPMQELAAGLSETMLSIDSGFEVTPSVNKTISRIYKDTRFSKDKSPYKTTAWITFKIPGKEWHGAPAYFFEITPTSYRYGMGFYSAEINTMDRLRKQIDKNQINFLKTIDFYFNQKIFVLEGEKYKRVLNAKLSVDIKDWYQRKNLYLVCNKNLDDALFSGKLLDDLISGFKLLSPFYHYLWELKE